MAGYTSTRINAACLLTCFGFRWWHLLIFLPVLITNCDAPGQNDQVFYLNPILNSPVNYSVKQTSSEWFKENRTGSDSTRFKMIFVEKHDSILSCKLFLNYLGTQFPNGRRISTNEPTGKLPSGSTDFIALTAFLQKQLIADSFWVIMQTNGTVLRVDGFDSIVSRISMRFDIDRRTIWGMLHERAGNNAIRDMLTQLFFYLPAKPVKENDSWVKNIMVTLKAPVKYSNLVQVIKIDKDSIFLKVQTAVTAKTGEGGTIYEEGKRTADISVSKTTGLPFLWKSKEQTIYKSDHLQIKKQIVIEGRRI